MKSRSPQQSDVKIYSEYYCKETHTYKYELCQLPLMKSKYTYNAKLTSNCEKGHNITRKLDTIQININTLSPTIAENKYYSKN